MFYNEVHFSDDNQYYFLLRLKPSNERHSCVLARLARGVHNGNQIE